MFIPIFYHTQVEASAILRSLTPDSLIVIDELGRSTGTFDGFGIAQAISEHLANSRAYVLFATHFHHLGLDVPRIGRLCMKSSFQNDIFVNHYRAEEGTAQQSFGIELAKHADMPSHIVANAAEKLEQMQKSLGDSAYYEKLISVLERKLDEQRAHGDESMEANNDDQSYKQYLKNQIRDALTSIDWKQY